MKKTKKEIKDQIDKATSSTKKYEIDTYESILNTSFLPDEIVKQKRMQSKIDVNNECTTIQKVSYINEISENFFSNFINTSLIFIKRNFPFMIIISLIGIIFTFISIGIVPGENGPNSINDAYFVGKISKALYLNIFFIPTLIWMFWAVPSFILSIREDNYISRLKMKGYSEIQLIINIFIISVITLLLFQLIMFFVWIPIDYEIGLALNPELSDGFFNWDKIHNVAIFANDIPFLLITSITGIIIGFKSRNQKLALALTIIFLLSGMYLAYNEVWYFGTDLDQSVVDVVHGFRILNIPYLFSSSIFYNLTTTTLLSQTELHNIEKFSWAIAIVSSILPFVIILTIPKKIVSYKPVI